ncbi:hypothetical protein BS50DRAFT_482795 [Corynespora cassiicola Philippines]|uniref:Methyltransferase domain-containing protein n=1 Tax=Corynespora cassiicola Philippines TaxID=1448308 RepID=A0A2T2P4Z8_CORCC|nr:hypothetical protein BS50DRAFT_482795 [Corynespora cassiicola Philippines]
MPPQPPSFGSQQYWDNRFTSNSHPFEWLEAPNALDPYLVAALNQASEPQPQVLHIGCGTSLLSYHLRAHVDNPVQIHNVDYSKVAVEVGKKREIDIYDKTEESTLSSTPQDKGSTHMRWSSADLLDHSSLLQACDPSAYSIIVDKSTSDSIACADDVYVPLPYHIGTRAPRRRSTALTKSTEPIHPLHILAIHLALVAKPGAKWISLSYSMDRYPFEDAILDEDLDNIPQKVIDSGLPDPATLWRLEGKYEIEVPPQESPQGNGAAFTTHRPKVLHWVYVLVRTDVEVFVRDV